MPLIHAIVTKIMCASPYIVGYQMNCHGEIILLNVQSYKHTCSISTLGTSLDVYNTVLPGRVGQSVTCLATDACLTADPGVASSIPVRSNTFVEIDHEMISTVILLPSADLFKKGCCQLQAKACARITG